MALWARKVSGAFEKQAPGPSKSQAKGNALWEANKHYTPYYSMGYQQNFSIKVNFRLKDISGQRAHRMLNEKVKERQLCNDFRGFFQGCSSVSSFRPSHLR